MMQTFLKNWYKLHCLKMIQMQEDVTYSQSTSILTINCFEFLFLKFIIAAITNSVSKT